MNRTLRWALLIPSFIIWVSLSQAAAEIGSEFLYSMIFPINSIGDLVGVPLFGPFLFAVPWFFGFGVYWVLNIAPNRFLAAKIMLPITVFLYILAYATNYEALSTKRLFFDAVTVLVLIGTAVSKPKPEEA